MGHGLTLSSKASCIVTDIKLTIDINCQVYSTMIKIIKITFVDSFLKQSNIFKHKLER